MKKITLLLYSLIFSFSTLFSYDGNSIPTSTTTHFNYTMLGTSKTDTCDTLLNSPTTTSILFPNYRRYFNFDTLLETSNTSDLLLATEVTNSYTNENCIATYIGYISGYQYNIEYDQIKTTTHALSCQNTLDSTNYNYDINLICPTVDGVKWSFDDSTCECIQPCVEPDLPIPAIFYDLGTTREIQCIDNILTDDEKKFIKRVYPGCPTSSGTPECYKEGYEDNDQLCIAPKVTVYDNTILAYVCDYPLVKCTADQYKDTSVIPNKCIDNPICAPDKYLETSFTPPTCSKVPDCPWDNDFFNKTTEKCECLDGFVLDGANCLKDTDKDGVSDTKDDDIDGDGIPNDTDTDDDGDGIPDENDPDSQTNSTCDGEDIYSIQYFGVQYPTLLYRFYGKTTVYDCTYLSSTVLNSSGGYRYDGSYLLADKNIACEDSYCYSHEPVVDCNYDITNYKPSPEWTYKLLASTPEACVSYVDNINYSNHMFFLPNDIDCPNTGFCYLLPILNPDTNETNIDDNPDLNSTTADLAPLLEAQNITNDHLDNIENKIDKTNEELKDLNANQSDMLALQQQIKQRLDDTTLEEIQKDILSEQKSTNTKLDASSGQLKDIANKLSLNGNDLSNISSNTKNINDNLINMTDILNGNGKTKTINNPLSDVNYTDGSSGFLGYETELKDNMALTYESDFFGLSSLGSSGLTTISFSFYGTSIIVFEPSMLDGIPIADIRNLFMFFFALAGFITVFRTI